MDRVAGMTPDALAWLAALTCAVVVVSDEHAFGRKQGLAIKLHDEQQRGNFKHRFDADAALCDAA